MPRGGPRPGAGRPKGSKNRTGTSASKAQAAAETPLSYMLRVMNDGNADDARRDRMAVSAAPFVHKRADVRGKKDQAAEDAETAGTGSEWGEDLQSGSGRLH